MDNPLSVELNYVSVSKIRRKFYNGYVISSHTLLDMWLFIHADIKVNSCMLGKLDMRKWKVYLC